MRSDRLGLVAFSALGALACALTACGDAPTSAAPAGSANPAPTARQSARQAVAAPPLARVLSRNARGSARMLAGAFDLTAAPLAINSEAAARLHLDRNSGLMGLSQEVLRDAVLTEVHPLAGGAGVYKFTQRVDGVEVFGGRASVVLDASRRLVSIANGLAETGKARIAKAAVFALTAELALTRAYELIANVPLAPSAVQDIGPRGEDVRGYALSTAAGAMRILEATTKRIFYPEHGSLTPGYYVEILGRDPGSKIDRAMGYAIDAKDGRVLYQVSLTQNETFGYRVWADPSGNHIPTDGPFVDYTPHPTGTPGGARLAFTAPSLIMMEGFNKNPNGQADPWLSASDTTTFGNNVRAYSDRNDVLNDSGAHHNDGYNAGVDIRADVTAFELFDRTYDVTKAPNASTDQIKAAVTQIFYVTNWLHDYWYDSGFDEKSGVAQLSNYGRGGKEGDPLRAEAQDEADSGEANNANMTTFADGTSPRMQMYVWRGSPMRDGTIDNTVVAHEWGHYLHHRLVLCGSPQCGGMSEGWADFDALMMVIKDGDRFDGGQVYPLAQYATSGLSNAPTSNSAYFGIRRAPYSTDVRKNPFTFKHVRKASTLPSGAPLASASPNLSEIHNVGEIWASALFEGYVNLLNVGKAANRSFDETKRRMADYVVAGMKAAPTEPTFVEQRDALLSAVLATGRVDDFSALAQGFAKRGLGVAAVAPPISSSSLNESVENFDAKGNLTFVDATIDDSTHSCDNDGYLDASEAGKLNIRVRNGGWLTLTKTQVKVTSNDPNITIDGGGLATVPSVAPYQLVPLSIGVSASNVARGRSTVPISITLSDPDAANPSSSVTFSAVFNLDDKVGLAAIDDVESQNQAFVPTLGSKSLPEPAWSRKGDYGAAGHVWHGDDIGTTGDETLVSPTLAVSTTAAFTIAFSHRYEFESGPPAPNKPDVYFDGGVLELSDDDGATWKDISSYANPSYTRTVYVSNDQGQPNTNPLAGRRAFGGQSANYPTMADVSLDLGMRLAGKMVKIRFRIGTDQGTGAAGWDVDNIAFGGITNTPFASLVDNEAPTCAVIAALPAAGGGGGGLSEGGGAGSERPAVGGATSAAGIGGTATTVNVTGADPGAAATAPRDPGCSCSTVASAPVDRYGGAFAILGLLTFVLRRRRTPLSCS